MIFFFLSSKLQDTFKKLRGKGKLNEKDIKEAMREIKLSLLEADVNFKVVKDFINTVTERSIGQEVMESLTPGQHVVKIVHDELTNLMSSKEKVIFTADYPNVWMFIGLQGSGKTTTTAKLARLYKKSGKSPLLAACDIYRPAAIKQLENLGQRIEVPVFSMGDKVSPVNIAKAAVEHARKNGNDLVILDTAGRLHIDEALMDELKQVKETVKPQNIFLVVDSMTGQDAVNVAQSFNNEIGVNGVILTKLDGDTRGGAALSIKSVTGRSIFFASTGEKLEDIEHFHADRLASRILGMGDVLTLIEKVQQNIDFEKAKEMEKKLRKAEFTFDDFLSQLDQVEKMGPMDQILGMIPGLNLKKLDNLNMEENQMKRIRAIIQSMTPQERKMPAIINGSRKKRIARGSGTSIQDVNRFIKQFEQTQKMMKQFSQKGKGKLPKFPFM
jgi:signal recognition particle subunit SRP54